MACDEAIFRLWAVLGLAIFTSKSQELHGYCPGHYRQLPPTEQENHCMNLRNNFLTTKNANISENANLSIVISFKIDRMEENCLNVMAYEAEEHYSVRLVACANEENKSLSLKFGLDFYQSHMKDEIDVTLEIFPMTWYKLSLTWKTNNSFEVVIFSPTAGVEFSQSIPRDLGDDIHFFTDGYFSFGSRTDDRDSNWTRRKGGLWIDEISLFERAITIDELKEIGNDERDGMSSRISFSKGQGRGIFDEYYANHLHIVGDRTQIPLWTTCPSTSLAKTTSPWVEYNSENVVSTAEQWCVDLIYHDTMVAECGQHLPPGVAQKFYTDCVNDVAEGGNTSMAIVHLQSYAEYCQLSLCSEISPIHPVCDTIPTKMTPSKCFQMEKMPCYSGEIKDGACQCYRGWFGRTCSSVCPGGVETPCGGVGLCEQNTGLCLCPLNYNETTHCTTCSPGFFGQNCSIRQLDIQADNELATASIYGYSHVLTFDGLAYTLPTPGEFVFFHGDINVYIKQMSRSDSNGLLRYFTGQIWIKSESGSITVLPSISTLGVNEKIGLILVNETIADFDKGEENGLTIGEGMLLWKTSDDWIEMKLDSETRKNKQNKPGCQYLRINVKSGMLNLFLTCWKERKSRYHGRAPRRQSLSEFRREINPEATKANGGDDSGSLTLNKFANASRMPEDVERGFAYTFGDFNIAQQHDTSAGNCLRFLAWNESMSLNEEAHINALSAELGSAVDIGEDLSLEMYMKSEKDGVFFSYSSGSEEVSGFSLAVVNGNVMLIIDNGNSMDVGLRVPQNIFSTWGQLSINCQRKSGIMWLYYTDANETVHESQVLTLDVLRSLSTPEYEVGCSSWFSPQGSILFGQTAGNVNFFIGSIDEVRIWNRVLSVFEVKQNFGQKIVPSQTLLSQRTWEPKLTSVWNFDEGRGSVARNLVSGAHDVLALDLPSVPDNSNDSMMKARVLWTSSGAPISILSCCGATQQHCSCSRYTTLMIPSMYIKDERKWAEKLCRESLNAVLENPSCVRALGRIHDVFFMQCIEDLIRMNTSDAVESARDTLAALCRFILNRTDPCLPNPCENGGLCGMVDGVNYRCECQCGYTGKDCETDIDECEGNPCSDHGLCKDGICGFSCDCHGGYVGKMCQRRCTDAIGLESGAIADSQVKASSEYRIGMPWYISYLAERARLNRVGWGAGWVPSDDDDSPWIQISFLEPMRITEIALQGVRWNGYDAWTTKFAINISDDSLSWRQCGDEIAGNDNSMRTVHQAFMPEISTRHVRLIPVDWHVKPAVRMELYGCTFCDCCRELGMESFFIENKQITASSVYGEKCSRCSVHTAAWPHYGRLDGPRNRYADFNLWMAKKDDAYPWIMVDLLRPHNVNGVIVQGGHWYRYHIFVTSFTVRYSVDNKVWNRLDQVFEGNQDSKSHHKVVFNSAFQARFVKIVLKSWRTHPGLRFEVLGCSVDEYF